MSEASNTKMAEIYLSLAQQCLELARLYEDKGFTELAETNRTQAKILLDKHEFYKSMS